LKTRATPERFRSCVHDEALYKSTFSLPYLTTAHYAQIKAKSQGHKISHITVVRCGLLTVGLLSL